MNTTKFDDSQKTYSDSLGISKERADELIHQFKLIDHESRKPLAKGEKPKTIDFFLSEHLKLVDSSKGPEIAFVSYFAGMSAARAKTVLPGEDEGDNCDCDMCVASRNAGDYLNTEELILSLLKSGLNRQQDDH